MQLGIATDHGGFRLKEDLLARLRAAGHDVVDFGARALNPTTTIPTSSSRSPRQWPQERSSAASRCAAAASAPRSVPTRFPERTPPSSTNTSRLRRASRTTT